MGGPLQSGQRLAGMRESDALRRMFEGVAAMCIAIGLGVIRGRGETCPGYPLHKPLVWLSA
jgi:hypothetical protein